MIDIKHILTGHILSGPDIIYFGLYADKTGGRERLHKHTSLIYK